LAAGYSSRFFPSTGRLKRAVFALVSLYVAGFLFGGSIGAFTLLIGQNSGGSYRNPGEVVLEPALGALYGLTFGIYTLALWPLAYANHSFVSRLWRESG
jgi:hypothetical protein